MSCSEIVDELPLYVYGELTQEEEERLEQHMAACGGCASELARLRAFENALTAAETPLPATLLTECRAQLHRALLAEPSPVRQPKPDWMTRLRGLMNLHIGFRVPAGALALVAVGFLAGKISPGGLPFANVNQAGFVTVRSVEPADASGKVRIAFENVSEKTISGSPDDPKIRELLLASMKNQTNPGLRVEAVGIIKDHAADADVRDALLDALEHDPNVGVRMNAIEGLKQIGTDAAVRKALTEVLLNDANAGVRMKAIDLLTAHKDQSIVGPLQDAMQKEDNGYVRMRMTNALREMNASLGTF